MEFPYSYIVEPHRDLLYTVTLPDIRGKAIFDLFHIGSIAWQLLTQHTFFQEGAPYQSGNHDGHKQQTIPRAEEQGRPQKEEKRAAIERMAHNMIGSGGDDPSPLRNARAIKRK